MSEKLSESLQAMKLNCGLRIFFAEFVRVSLRRPAQAAFFARVLFWQWRAARWRPARHARECTFLPIAIFSITNGCNPRCKGCYAQAIRGDAPAALSSGKLRDIVREGDELGVSFFVIAGGEPLTRPEIIDVARDCPHTIFLLVTNGTLLDDALVARLAALRNVVPALKAARIFFGLSSTIPPRHLPRGHRPYPYQGRRGPGLQALLPPGVHAAS